MEGEVQYCKNCKRDINSTNYVIHSVHCERKIQLCDRCLEPVPRSDLEKHETEFHLKEICSECGISMEKWQMEKHKETCVKRLVPCEYCELEVPLKCLSEHNAACRSRTEQCTKCKKYVMLKDLDIHHMNCSRRDTCTRKLVSCEYCELEIPLSIHLEHNAACGSRTEQCIKCKKYVMIKDMEMHHTNCSRRDTCTRKFVSCEYCGLDIPLSIHLEHSDACGSRTKQCSRCNKYVMIKDLEKHHISCLRRNMSKAYGNCPVCHQSVPWIEMNDHSIHCAEIYYETKDEEFASKNTEEKSPQKHMVENVEICPSCKYTIPEQKYHEHLLLCFNGTTQCHICGIDVPRNYEDVHFQDCHKIV